jgi:hypothetical protein
MATALYSGNMHHVSKEENSKVRKGNKLIGDKK